MIPTNRATFSPGHMRTDDHDEIPCSAPLSEQWLLERTYHAHLLNGKELSIARLTKAMSQLIDIAVPLSSPSSRPLLPERLLRKKSSTFSVPIPTWQEITQAEARTAYEQGIPILLVREPTENHAQGRPGRWGPNRNMRALIFGNTMPQNTMLQPEVTSTTTYAVCYLDARQGTFANVAWKMRCASDLALLFQRQEQPITFLRPCLQFPFTTHYTIITWDGRVSEYPDRAAALQGFATAPLQEMSQGNTVQMVVSSFCYYHEVTCPSGTYRLEFFGPRMNEQGYPRPEPLPVIALGGRSS